MARWLFISDLHLAAERPHANEQFFRFLSEDTHGAEALCVLGDLFEYWIGDDELLDAGGEELARAVAGAFSTLRQSGVAVHVMHGNRDFLMGSGFAETAGVRLLEDPSVLQVAGTRTLLMHGDTLCTDDHDYQEWRRTARSSEWQRRFLGAPLAERRAQMRQLRERSRREKVLAVQQVSLPDPREIGLLAPDRRRETPVRRIRGDDLRHRCAGCGERVRGRCPQLREARLELGVHLRERLGIERTRGRLRGAAR